MPRANLKQYLKEKEREALAAFKADCNEIIEMNKMFKDNSYFEKYWEQDKLGIDPTVSAIGRRGWYPDGLSHGQLIPGKWNWHEYRSCRTPVVMRGSRFCMQNKYNCKYGIAQDIIERYLHRIKYTCADFDAHLDFVKCLVPKLFRMGYVFSDKFIYDWHVPERCGGMWFAGKWVHQGDDEFLKIMEKVNMQKAYKIKEDLRYLEAKKLWDQERTVKRKLSEEQATKKAEEKRQKKIQQIAAYELIMEVKNGNEN